MAGLFIPTILFFPLKRFKLGTALEFPGLDVFLSLFAAAIWSCSIWWALKASWPPMPPIGWFIPPIIGGIIPSGGIPPRPCPRGRPIGNTFILRGLVWPGCTKIVFCFLVSLPVLSESEFLDLAFDFLSSPFLSCLLSFLCFLLLSLKDSSSLDFSVNFYSCFLSRFFLAPLPPTEVISRFDSVANYSVWSLECPAVTFAVLEPLSIFCFFEPALVVEVSFGSYKSYWAWFEFLALASLCCLILPLFWTNLFFGLLSSKSSWSI